MPSDPAPPTALRHTVRATGIAAAVVTAAGLARFVRCRRDLRAVSPELRTPVLLLPTSVPNRWVLALARKVVARRTKLVPGVTVRTERLPRDPSDPAASDRLRLLVYVPPERPRPGGALVWIHGGGTIMGIPEQAHDTASRIAAGLGIVVVSVDYRLAPEDPYPAGLDDCYAAIQWLADHAGELGVDPARIAVGGDSAGGLLAASLAQHATARGGPDIAFQLLVYPMLDDRTVQRTAPGRRSFIWTPTSNRFAWNAYLGATAETNRTAAVPSRAEDLTGLPPAWIGVGDLDLFLDEDVDYATRLIQAGVPCELHVEPGMYHAADTLLPQRATMRAFRARMDAALAAAIG